MSSPHRKERLDELLLRELSSIIPHELSDPRLGGVEVTRVDISRDLQIAKVFVTQQDAEVDAREVMRGLENASGYLRSQIASRVQMRRTPEFIFRLDPGAQASLRIDALLDSIEYATDVNSDANVTADDDTIPAA